MLRIFFFVSILCLGSILTAQNAAQTSAAPGDNRSLDETTHWLQQQLTTYASAQYEVTTGAGQEKRSWKSTNTYHDFQFKGCEMTFAQDHQMDNRPARTINYSVPLWDLESIAYRLDNGNLDDAEFHYTPVVPSLWIKNHTNSIHWTKPRTYFPTDRAEIEFGHDLTKKTGGAASLQQTLNRIAAAFIHAGTLCASQAPKTGGAAQTPAPGATP